MHIPPPPPLHASYDPGFLSSLRNPPASTSQLSLIEEGTVGWGDDPNVVDPGTPENGGVDFLKVTLYKGKDPGVVLDPTRAQGVEVVVRGLGWPTFAFPPAGAHVVVAFPGGHANARGMGVIVNCPGPSPAIQLSTKRMKIDAGPDQDLILKGRSVTMSTYDNSYVVVSPDVGGARIGLKDGTAIEIKKGSIIMMVPDDSGAMRSCITVDKTGAVLAHKTPAGMISTVIANDNGVVLIGTTGQTISAIAPQVMLGALASPISAAMVGPSGAPGVTGHGSTSVFVSP